MHKSKCYYQIIRNILGLGAWAAAVLFFWSSIKQMPVFGYDALYFAWIVVILTLLSLTKGFCGCCWKGKMGGDSALANICSHEGGCVCGDCGRCKPM